MDLRSPGAEGSDCNTFWGLGIELFLMLGDTIGGVLQSLPNLIGVAVPKLRENTYCTASLGKLLTAILAIVNEHYVWLG
jgi:hypothetical protein